MNKLNAYIGTCKQCHECGAAHTISNTGEELSICYKCGALILNKKFDTLRFLTQLVHDGVTTDDGLKEQLEQQLNEVYSWLDWCDIEILAQMLVKSLADEARFNARAEDEEATEDYRETMVDYQSMALGVA